MNKNGKIIYNEWDEQIFCKRLGTIVKLYDSILDLIGGTPIVKLNRLPDREGADVYIKLESFNPGGSVKDRPAWEMIRRAEIGRAHV